MKVLGLLTLGLLMSCGKIPTNGKSGLGEIRASTPQGLSANEVQQLDTICEALRVKEVALGGFKPTQNFGVRQKSCEVSDLGTEESIQVAIVDEYGKLKYRPVNSGTTFPFPEVETRTSGALESVCGNTRNFSNPRVLAGEGVWITTQGIGRENCAPGTNEICVLVERGSPSGTGYRIHTKEWLKFNTFVTSGDSKVGYYLSRKLLTDASCSVDKTRIIEAILK